MVNRSFLYRLIAGGFLIMAPAICSATTFTGYATNDGSMGRTGVTESFSTIRSGNGTVHTDGTASFSQVYLYEKPDATNFEELYRSKFCFDTSSIPDDSIIDSANLQTYVISKRDQIGFTPDIDIVSAGGATNSIADSDFQTLGTTVYGSGTYASLTTSAYHTFDFNAAGIAYLDLTGTTCFGARFKNDVTGSAPPSASDKDFQVLVSSMEETGTSQDPLLTIVYHAPAAPPPPPPGGTGAIMGTGGLLMFNSYCNDYIPAVYDGSGTIITQAVCDQWATNIEIPAIRTFQVQSFNTGVVLMELWFKRMLLLVLLWISAKFVFRIITHRRAPNYRYYRRRR